MTPRGVLTQFALARARGELADTVPPVVHAEWRFLCPCGVTWTRLVGVGRQPWAEPCTACGASVVGQFRRVDPTT